MFCTFSSSAVAIEKHDKISQGFFWAHSQGVHSIHYLVDLWRPMTSMVLYISGFYLKICGDWKNPVYNQRLKEYTTA